MELLPLFRRCGTGPTEGVMRRIQPLGRQDWLLITDPTGGIPVALADMLILAEEINAFEEETPYDWEGMMVAQIHRIMIAAFLPHRLN